MRTRQRVPGSLVPPSAPSAGRMEPSHVLLGWRGKPDSWRVIFFNPLKKEKEEKRMERGKREVGERRGERESKRSTESKGAEFYEEWMSLPLSSDSLWLDGELQASAGTFTCRWFPFSFIQCWREKPRVRIGGLEFRPCPAAYYSSDLKQVNLPR